MRRFDWERALRGASEVRGPRMLTLVVVGMFLGLDGTGFVSVVQLADATKTSTRTVQRHLEWASARGWLRRAKRGGRGRASEYVLTTPDTQVSGDNESSDNQMSGGQSPDSQMSGKGRITGHSITYNRTVDHLSPDTQMSAPGPSPVALSQGQRESRAIDAPTASARATASDAEEAVRRVVSELGWDQATAEAWLSGLRAKCRNARGWSKFFETSLINEKAQLPPKPDQSTLDEQIQALKAGRTTSITFDI